VKSKKKIIKDCQNSLPNIIFLNKKMCGEVERIVLNDYLNGNQNIIYRKIRIWLGLKSGAREEREKRNVPFL
jgi:hypothetical protein